MSTLEEAAKRSQASWEMTPESFDQVTFLIDLRAPLRHARALVAQASGEDYQAHIYTLQTPRRCEPDTGRSRLAQLHELEI